MFLKSQKQRYEYKGEQHYPTHNKQHHHHHPDHQHHHHHHHHKHYHDLRLLEGEQHYPTHNQHHHHHPDHQHHHHHNHKHYHDLRLLEGDQHYPTNNQQHHLDHTDHQNCTGASNNFLLDIQNANKNLNHVVYSLETFLFLFRLATNLRLK